MDVEEAVEDGLPLEVGTLWTLTGEVPSEQLFLYSPQDILTRIGVVGSRVLVAVFGLILLPLMFVIMIIDGLLSIATFGLWRIVMTIALSIVWLPLLALLLSTSWLWTRAWPLRPLLLIPSMLVVLLAHQFILLTPEPETEASNAKFALSDSWPLTWDLMMQVGRR